MSEPTVEFDPASLVGYFDEHLGVEILAAPRWEGGRWVALVNYCGMLALAEISIKVKGRPS